ncbi:MAG: DsbC family protein [Gallionellaceae bacterium]|nr:DsbC family protein [Gallionellaceae bacterium]
MFRTLLLLLLTISFAHAETDKTAASIKETMQKNYEHLIGPVDQVNKSPIRGLYEVVTGNHIFYTDKNAQYLIDGQMFDLTKRTNLTEARARQLFAIDVNKLPLELALKKVKGNGKRVLITFEDPNCGYCKQLAMELEQVDDLTHYLFLYPVFNGSAELVRDLLCSKEPFRAWDDLMLQGINPPKGDCTTNTDQVMALGRKLKITGTPALIFANGAINPGFMPAADLNRALDSNSK